MYVCVCIYLSVYIYVYNTLYTYIYLSYIVIHASYENIIVL